MKTTFVATAVAVTLASTGYAQTFGPLVSPSALVEALPSEQPVVLDIRSRGYAESHIEGAVSAPYGLFRGPADNPGGLVDVEFLEVVLEQVGLSQTAPIVIVTDGASSSDFGAAARVYWTLKSTGFEDLSILNGGQAAWTSAGLPVTTEVAALDRTELDLSFDATWLATTLDVQSVVEGDTDAVLVDARLEPFYAGEKAHPAAAKPGTVPGAVSHAFTNFFDTGAPAITPTADAADLRATLGLEDGGAVISFCNTGHWAASHWFAVSELAGIEDAKLYAGSMVEYSNASLPMENAPGLMDNLLRQIGQ